ncbi:hypothetical protein MA16_Dca006108 [Dendrobium catenatum]|uniref:Uncharacterized protein n=1 Tax=Dendrobium catenatum TaxID=906689 RepID=A0A2I0X4I1_9ASPA|nr:hypothetical protein MA16_Dca006108 [Dendrobium catenatum]
MAVKHEGDPSFLGRSLKSFSFVDAFVGSSSNVCFLECFVPLMVPNTSSSPCVNDGNGNGTDPVGLGSSCIGGLIDGGIEVASGGAPGVISVSKVLVDGNEVWLEEDMLDEAPMVVVEGLDNDEASSLHAPWTAMACRDSAPFTALCGIRTGLKLSYQEWRSTLLTGANQSGAYDLVVDEGYKTMSSGSSEEGSENLDVIEDDPNGEIILKFNDIHEVIREYCIRTLDANVEMVANNDYKKTFRSSC